MYFIIYKLESMYIAEDMSETYHRELKGTEDKQKNFFEMYGAYT